MKKPHTFLDGYKDTFDVSSTKIRDLFKKHYACSPIDVEDEAFRCCSELEISTIQNNILKYLDMDACRYIIKHNLYQ